MDLNELNLISLAKEGDSNSIKQLIDMHSGIYVSTCKKYTNNTKSTGTLKDYIDSSKDYVIYNSAKTYNPDMGSKFSTWLSNQTRYFCLNCINITHFVFFKF